MTVSEVLDPCQQTDLHHILNRWPLLGNLRKNPEFWRYTPPHQFVKLVLKHVILALFCPHQALFPIQCYPTCFGGNSFGWSLSNGGDIHVVTNGNFHYQHCHSAGKSLIFYNSWFFLPKSQVNTVSKHIDQARKQCAHKRQVRISDNAVDHCKSTHEAADGKMQSYQWTATITPG